MTDEPNAQTKTDTERMRLAAGILNNPLFDEALVVLKEGYVQAMMKCDSKDDIGRHRYAFALRDLEIIKAHIVAVMQRGQLAQQEAEAMKQRDSVFKRTVRGFATG